MMLAKARQNGGEPALRHTSERSAAKKKKMRMMIHKYYPCFCLLVLLTGSAKLLM